MKKMIHEGKIISFWQNCTEGIIAYIIVPSETTDETIDKAVFYSMSYYYI